MRLRLDEHVHSPLATRYPHPYEQKRMPLRGGGKMSDHPPKGYLSFYTNGKVCMADGRGGETIINVLEILAERDQLRAEVQNERDGFQRVLAELQIVKQERDEFSAAKIHGMNRVDELIKECDQLRADVERLKEWNANQVDMIEKMRDGTIRPEPSKLEIATSLMSANIMHHGLRWPAHETLRQAVLREAGELIAASKQPTR